MKIEQRIQEDTKTATSFADLTKGYINQWLSTLHGEAEKVDAMNNGFTNMIVRKNQALIGVANQNLKLSAEPLDICNTYSVSTALNDLTCGALQSTYDNTSTYIKNLKNPYVVAHDVDDYKIDDIDTVAISTAPVILPDEPVLNKAKVLREQAYKSTVYSVMSSIKQSRENIANPLLNSAKDDFSGDSIKKIQETYARSQLYRKMAVMQAKMLAAQLNAYKQSLQKETVLAMQLSQDSNQGS